MQKCVGFFFVYSFCDNRPSSHLHASAGEVPFPKAVTAYLDDWAADARGWLRKYYPAGQDQPHCNLAASTVTALTWLQCLGQRSFIGAESRLLTVLIC